jgi:hypothetical protein
MVTGIGGGLGAANIMGMFGQQNTQQRYQPQSYADIVAASTGQGLTVAP